MVANARNRAILTMLVHHETFPPPFQGTQPVLRKLETVIHTYLPFFMALFTNRTTNVFVGLISRKCSKKIVYSQEILVIPYKKNEKEKTSRK